MVEFFESIKIFLISLLGGFVSYLYIHLKQKEAAKIENIEVKFDFEHMFILIVIGGFLGTIVEAAIPTSLEAQKGLIIGGVSIFAYPILSLIEKVLPVIVKKYTGVDPKDRD
jgi:hypothetical protein